MSKKHIIFIFIIFLLLVILFFMFQKTNQKKEEINIFQITKLMKNESFETNFEENIPYKKGDILETSYIIENNSDKKKTIKINKQDISNKLEIKELIINGDNKELNDLDIIEIESIPNEINQINIKGISKINKQIEDINNEKKENNELYISKEEEIKEKDDIKKENFTKINNNSSNGGSSTNTNNTNNTNNNTTNNNTNNNTTNNNTNIEKLSSNMNNLVILNYEDASNIDYIMIGEKSIKPSLIEGNKIYLNIEKDTFGNGDFFIAKIMKSGGIITSNDKLSFKYISSKINIANITPRNIKNDFSRPIVIQGNGFNTIVSVQLSNSLVLKKINFNIINDQVMIVTIPAGIEPGEYYLNLMDTQSIYEIKNEKFYITN